MKTTLAVMAVLMLAGCGNYDFSGAVESPTDIDSQTLAPVIVRSRPAAPPSIEARCRAVARQRTDDAAVNGVSEELQRDILNGTYTDCVDWLATHGS